MIISTLYKYERLSEALMRVKSSLYKYKRGWWAEVVMATMKGTRLVCGVCCVDQWALMYHVPTIPNHTSTLFDLSSPSLMYVWIYPANTHQTARSLGCSTTLLCVLLAFPRVRLDLSNKRWPNGKVSRLRCSALLYAPAISSCTFGFIQRTPHKMSNNLMPPIGM